MGIGFLKFELIEGKFLKAPQATGRRYKMVDPCFERGENAGAEHKIFKCMFVAQPLM